MQAAHGAQEVGRLRAAAALELLHDHLGGALQLRHRERHEARDALRLERSPLALERGKGVVQQLTQVGPQLVEGHPADDGG